MKDLLKTYRDRLTDLTASNKSLKLTKLTNKNHFDIQSFSDFEENLGSRVMDDVCSLKEQIPLIPQNSLEEEAILANRKLIQLKREIDLIEQETGNNPFYVTYGFLEGFLVPDFFVRCPILFYPARLAKANVRNKPHWVLEVGEETTPFINRTFLMAVQRYIGGDITNQIQEELSNLPSKKEEIISFLYELLRKYDISLTAETSGALLSFKNMKKEDITVGKKGFALYPYAVMGKFQQSTSTLLNDYNYLLDNLPESGFLNDLLNGPDQEDEDFREIDNDELNRVHPSENFFVLETDASQEAVVVASRSQKGLIVHGPPGTGKSQVIVNLIVDRLARGQKVLLVCQKPAALDVVYNRLGQISLQSHVALVHDFNKNKPVVYRKIATVIEKDAPRIHQDYIRISNEKHALAEKLNQIAGSLHKERPFGKSLHYLYSKAKWDQDLIIEVDDLLNGVTFEDLQAHLIELRNVVTLMEKYDHPNHPWSNRKSFASFTAKQHLELKNLLEPVVKDVKRGFNIRSYCELIFDPIYYLENVETLKELEQALRILQNRSLFKHILMFFKDEDRDFENEDHLQKVNATFGSLQKQINVLHNRSEPVENLTYDEAIKWSEKIKSFQELNKKITRYINTIWYSLRKEIQEQCKAAGISFDGNSVRNYLEKIESFILFEKLRKEAHSLNYYMDAPALNDINDWEKWITHKGKSIHFLKAFVQAQVVFPRWLKNPDKTEVIEKFTHEKFLDDIQRLIEIAGVTERLQSSMNQLDKYLKDEQLKEFLGQIHKGLFNVPIYQGLLQTLDDFTSICRLDQLRAEMDELQKKLIERSNLKAPLATTINAVDIWALLIENSFIHAWILQVESEDPHVKDVSTEIYQNNLERYRTLLHEKRAVVPQVVDHKLGTRANEVQGSSRQKLKSEANKKRRLAPLRHIVSHFYDDLLKLVPCWLCTPESVSAIFPMNQEMFDLVIFDEASQCPVENAIPSIYRGKQVVVAGDEKQLPPSSFFQSVGEEEDEEEEDNTTYVDKTDKQAKSLLEWAKPKFPEQWLTWHYRSQYEELINFSNYAFYDKRVQIAPTVSTDQVSKPIEFIPVNGQWLNRSNRVEAEQIVETVLDILKNDDKKPTLGIITFNKQQADLINDIFEEKAAEDAEHQFLIEEAKNRKNGEENVGLFVKNIENVQGDERDIILFSVGYAKDIDGKMVNQFGPLSRDGGENRLNVAITRAKSKVYIVCSFEPSGWTRVETYAKGVRLLKRYLEYGKAISDNDKPLAQSILNGLIDATNVQDSHNQLIFDSGFEEEVYNALRRLNFEVRTQIGFSGYRIDLGVLDPVTKDKYILGIECDGAMYHSSKVARERDIYRQRFLESKGWRIHRIWSRNWWISKEKEVAKIEKLVDELVSTRRNLKV
ncbi:AAA domain-containing protein [Brevibacillus centrosporus]|uniref:AAA domain-containing protein n=1 Tax=Brevibacillus centrosporus TaxID=54910 RepID=UPI003D247FBA